MDITVGKNELFEGLQKVFSVVPQKPTLPVLSNFLIKTSEGAVSISGTDMDIAVTTSIPCTVESEGEITVGAKRFIGLIRELPEEMIRIETTDEKMTVNYSSGHSTMMGMSAADYPSVKESVEGVSVPLDVKEFVRMVEKTEFSVAADRTRPALTGVYWKISENDVIMVATDGHRLSLYEKRMTIETDKVSEAIVPPKALTHAARVISSGEEMQRCVFSRGAILFDFGNTTIFSKLIEGPYPNFRQVIPTQNSKNVLIATEALASVVRRVSVLSSAITHQVRLSLMPGKVEISTTNPDIGGESRETVPVEYEGESLVIGLNASFLLEILRRVDSENVMIELETSTSACILRQGEKKDSEDYLYLIMPLRLSE